MFAGLDRPAAPADQRHRVTRHLETAAEPGFVLLMSGLGSRLRPGWGKLIGCSMAGLEEMQMRAIKLRARLTGRFRAMYRRSCWRAGSGRGAMPIRCTAPASPTRRRTIVPSRSAG